jgi:hypothetical protein
MVYRVVIKIGYQEVAFDFAGSEDAVRFLAQALRKLNLAYEDGNRMSAYVEKVDIEAEMAEQEKAEAEKED